MAIDKNTGNSGSKSSSRPRGWVHITHGASCGSRSLGYAAFPLSYRSWLTMRRRCTDSKIHDYHRYGGRGIRVYSLWMDSYAEFYLYMGDCPPKHTLDRINPNGHYEPGNVRWADASTQARNCRNTPRMMLDGQLVSIADACERLSFNHASIKTLACRERISSAEVLSEFISGKRRRYTKRS